MRVSFKNNDILCLGQLGVDRQFQDFFFFFTEKVQIAYSQFMQECKTHWQA